MNFRWPAFMLALACNLMTGCVGVFLMYADVHVGVAAGSVGLIALVTSVMMCGAVWVYVEKPIMEMIDALQIVCDVEGDPVPLKASSIDVMKELQSEVLSVASQRLEPGGGKRKRHKSHINKSSLQISLPDSSSSSIPEAVFTPILVAPPEGKVTFVFTDIESSSVLWRKYPDDMKVAMKQHNLTIRQAYSRHNGYEVKTIGDAFMVVFDQATDAVRFCCDSQIDLLNCPWPERLLKDSMCNATIKGGQLIYRGMRVRMGVHTGDVQMEIDPVTNRADYFGHTVNTAARIESAGQGGCIVCSTAVTENINPARLECSIVDLGSLELKGVGKVTLHGIVPSAISERGASLAYKKTPLQSSLHPSNDTGTTADKAKLAKNAIKDTFNDRHLTDSYIKAVVAAINSTDELQAIPCTLIQVRVGPNIERLDRYMELINTLTKKTFGIILSGPLSTISIVWICNQHPIQAITFATQLYTETTLRPEYKMHVGMASGIIKFGFTFAGDRMYATCVGSPVDLSGALAEASEQLDTACLVPATIVAHTPSLTRYVRPVDRWYASSAKDAYIEVNELHLAGITNTEKWDLLYGVNDFESWCDPEWAAAFDDAKNGDLRMMRTLSERHTEDTICKRIVECEGGQICRMTFLPGQQIIPSENDGRSKVNLEEAWKRTAAASRSNAAALVFMEGWAYDVSAFMHSHPGGRGAIRPWIGKDITDVFRGQAPISPTESETHDHSQYACEILRTLRVFKTHNLATNESNLMIIRASWKQLKSVGLQELGFLLFKNMFEMHPEYLQLFPWGSETRVYESQGMLDHGLQVMTAVDKAVTDLANSHEVAHILHELGKTHLRFGVKKPMFDVMASAFDATLRMALEEKYTPQVRYAWVSTINHIMLMAKDGIADMKDDSDNAIVTGEYRNVTYMRREARTHTATMFTFHIHGASQQYFAPGCHVSLRFNGKLSRTYNVMSVLNDEISILVKLVPGKKSSKELQMLNKDSIVEMRGPLLGEHQYTKGQDLVLIGGGMGCNPLLSLAKAALRDSGKVWFVYCANTYGDVAAKPELEELKAIAESHTGASFKLLFVFTRGKTAPEGLTCVHVPMLAREHLKPFIPKPSAENHCVICGTPAFNTNIRRLVLDLKFTFTICGELSESAQGRKKSWQSSFCESTKSTRCDTEETPLPGIVETAPTEENIAKEGSGSLRVVAPEEPAVVFPDNE
eukprot:TRINITY_DN2779_c1_g2_i2.p1 TRINITY_DN2779_c1_g2~~TRINITY_DN2779_c1_g2_i2.p1  ORF type:complete len:1219 (+),score=265.87 TRINITY_DN2779_c1_g2_i2:35-3658(+)